MRYHLFKSSFLFLVTAFVICSCDLVKKEHRLIQLKPSDNNPQKIEATVAILNKRLKTVYEGDVVAMAKNGQIELDVTGEVNLRELINLVTRMGSLSMHEVYPAQELQQAIIAIDPDLKNVGFLVMDAYSYGGIGKAGRYDTAAVMASATIKAIKQRYNNLEFCWGKETMEDWTFPLYALKRSRSGLTNTAIETSEQDLDYGGRPAVSIKLKGGFHNRWAEMTRENIGKQIAIRVDDQVLSAPTVNSEIPNGALQISGGGDDFQPRVLAALIANEVLPMKLTVLSVDPALEPSAHRSFPTAAQIARYDSMRKDYIQLRHGIDSILLSSGHSNIAGMRREVSRVYYEDLPTVVDQVGLTEEQVNLFLDKAEGTLGGLKTILQSDGTPESSQDFFESLEAK